MHHTHLELGHFGYLFYPLSGLRLNFAVVTGFNPALFCVDDDARVEFARGVLNIHFAFTSVPTIQYSAIIIWCLTLWGPPRNRTSFHKDEYRSPSVEAYHHVALLSKQLFTQHNLYIAQDFIFAVMTGLEPATSYVTGRRSTNWTTPLFLWISDRL